MWQIVATIELGGKREGKLVSEDSKKREKIVKIDNKSYRNLKRKFQQRFWHYQDAFTMIKNNNKQSEHIPEKGIQMRSSWHSTKKTE